MKAYVIVKGEPLLLERAEVTDIEENPAGDVVTFDHEGQSHQSLIVIKPWED